MKLRIEGVNLVCASYLCKVILFLLTAKHFIVSNQKGDFEVILLKCISRRLCIFNYCNQLTIMYESQTVFNLC